MKDLFKVVEILNGNTILLSSNWNIGGVSNNVVTIDGYVPILSKRFSKKYKSEDIEAFSESYAKQRLITLLENNFVSLRLNPTKTAQCINHNNVLICQVYLNDVDISYYFPEYEGHLKR